MLTKILTLIFLLFSCSTYATEVVIGQPYSAPPAYTCPSGTYKFAWDGDYDADKDKGCFASGASTKDGTCTVDNAPDGTCAQIGASYGRSGNGFRINGPDDLLSWLVATDDGLDEDTGTLYMDIYLYTNPLTVETEIFQSMNDGDNYIDMYVNTSTTIYSRYTGNLTTSSIGTAGTISYATWTRIGYAWQTSTNKHAIRKCTDGVCDAESWTEETEIVAWGADDEPDDITIGDEGASADEIWIDNIIVYGTYKQED